MLHRLASHFVALFCRLSFDKSTGWQSQDDPTTQLGNPEEKGVFCAYCDARLTGHEQALSFAGAHRHQFINPVGVEFEIALYRDAQVQTYGIATEEHTWFRGYAWQVVLCADCHMHVGWRYHSHHSPDFYGLITTHIIEK